MRRLGTILLVCAASASCAGRDGPTWISLAKGFSPSMDVAGRWEAPFDGTVPLSIARHESEEDGVWIRAEIAASDWRKSKYFPDAWQLLRPVMEEGAPADGAPQELGNETLTYQYLPVTLRALRQPKTVPTGSFCGYLDQVYLRLEPGAEPPDGLTYSVFVNRGRVRDGTWRIRLGAYTCDGIPVWSGHTEQVEVDVAPASALRFTVLTRASSARGMDDATVTLRVLADGEQVFSSEQAVSDVEAVEHHVVDLSAHAGDDVKLTFMTEGSAAIAAFLTPIVGPLEIGKSGARPWGQDRPDLMLFLADTFRADNMVMYGNELDISPRLDRLAERSMAFSRAWGPASWTLPSQASMMSGLLPYQHGATGSLMALPDEAVTIAEHLEHAGYRTVGVTGAAFLSHRYAMDQGFGWFDELPGDKSGVLDKDAFDITLERADHRMAADDGRPLFIFVQTYRVHFPYVVSEQTRREYGDRLELDAHWKELEAVMREQNWSPGEGLFDEVLPTALVLRDLYLGGVVDFDRSFGSWIDRYEASGFFDNGVLLFTSDHGEAFGEHMDFLHGNGVWESQIRIPLFLFGAGIEPSLKSHAATLVDLPRTLAALAGLAPSARWGGESLLELDHDRPVYSFESSVHEGSAQAVIDGKYKLILFDTDAALREKDVSGAFVLDEDRNESQNLAEAEADWIDELATRRFPEVLAVRRPILRKTEIKLSVEDLDELQKLGYAGEEE